MKVDGQDKSKYSFIVRLPKTVKTAIGFATVFLLLLITIVTIFISKKHSEPTTTFSATIVDFFSPLLEGLSYPVEQASVITESILDHHQVNIKNQNLEKRNQILEKKLSYYIYFAKQNKELKDLLSFTNQIKYKKISAQIVGNNSGAFNRSLMVLVKNDGNINKGQAVVASTGLVGRVNQVGKRSAQITLITDIRSKIPVKTNISQEKAIMIGNNSNDPQLVYMRKDNEIKEGEVVFTSGDGNLFPPDIIIGKIYKNAYGEFFIKPFSIWHKLNFLSILSYDKESVTIDEEAN